MRTYYTRMQRTNIHLTPAQRKRLAALRRVTGLTIAEIVRRAVDAYLLKDAKESGAK